MRPEDEALVQRVPADRLGVNGVPGPEEAAARERAAHIVRRSMKELALPCALRVSPLGAAWSGDIDAYVPRMPSDAELERFGWVGLDGILRRLGSDPNEGHWAVVDGEEILACVDFTVGSLPDPVLSVASRCRRKGMVRLRELLELRALHREGLDVRPAGRALSLAARAEAGLGGSELSRWADGPPIELPADLPGARLRRVWRLRASLRPRVVVAISGVDGAGKSTLSRGLERDLRRASLPVSVVWTRPGMGIGLGLIEGLAGLVKRALGQGSAPGVRRVAAGETLPWRRGPVGWAWAMLITLSFLADVRWQHLRGTGILLYDRHVLDAVVTLDFVYGGVDLRLHRSLIRRLLPRAALSIYLDVPPAVAVARKPGDSFGEYAVIRQIAGYAGSSGQVPDLRRLDATRPAGELAAEVFRLLVDTPP